VHTCVLRILCVSHQHRVPCLLRHGVCVIVCVCVRLCVCASVCVCLSVDVFGIDWSTMCIFSQGMVNLVLFMPCMGWGILQQLKDYATMMGPCVCVCVCACVCVCVCVCASTSLFVLWRR